MATTFPTGLDSLVNPASTDTLDNPSHSDQHININDAVEAIETKVGIDSSAVTTSLDYKVNTARTGSDTNLVTGTKGSSGNLSLWNGDGDLVDGPTPPSGTIVGTADTQTLTNKTLTSPVINTPTGDVATLTGTQTLTNKTLTNPTVNFTDNAVTQNVKCKAFLTTGQDNIADDTATKVLLETEVYDIGSDFDTTNKRFVAPVTGYYLIAAQVYWKAMADNKRYGSLIYVNGGAVAQGSALGHSGISRLSTPVSTIQKVNSGEYIELYAIQTSGVATPDIEGGTQNETFMAIHLLSI